MLLFFTTAFRLPLVLLKAQLDACCTTASSITHTRLFGIFSNIVACVRVRMLLRRRRAQTENVHTANVLKCPPPPSRSTFLQCIAIRNEVIPNRIRMIASKGGGRYSFVSCLGNFTIDHASLLIRRGGWRVELKGQQELRIPAWGRTK